jgi:hypothetical protein
MAGPRSNLVTAEENYMKLNHSANAGIFTLIAVANVLLFVGSAQAQVFVTENHAGLVGEYNTDGSTVNASLVSTDTYPDSIAISGADIFVANYDGNTVSEYTFSGATVHKSLFTYPLNGGAPAIAISGSNIFLYDGGNGANNSSVGEYTTSGAIINASLITIDLCITD